MCAQYSKNKKVTRKRTYEDLGYVLRGKQRRTVLKVIDRPMVPSQVTRSIKGEYRISLNNVSRVLCDLERRGLVKCVTPDKATGRVYLLTDRGKHIRKKIVSQEET